MGKERSPRNEKRKPTKRGTVHGEKAPSLKSKLNEKERIWVIKLQEELRKAADLKEFTEWDIACHAIVAKDQPHKAVHRLRRLQKFRQAYNVPQHPTVYEAIQTMHDFCHAYSNFVQAVGQDVIGRWVLSFQLKSLANVEQQPEMSVENQFTALYFLMGALQPDLDAVRKGTIWIGDLQDVSRQSLPLSTLNGARALCKDAYPI